MRLNGNVSVALYGLISFFWPPAVTFAGGPGGTASTAKRTGTPAAGTFLPKPGSGCTLTNTFTAVAPSVIVGVVIERLRRGSRIARLNVAEPPTVVSVTVIVEAPAIAFDATRNWKFTTADVWGRRAEIV